MYGRRHCLDGQTAGPLAPIPLVDTPKEGADLFDEVADLSVGIDRREGEHHGVVPGVGFDGGISQVACLPGAPVLVHVAREGGRACVRVACDGEASPLDGRLGGSGRTRARRIVGVGRLDRPVDPPEGSRVGAIHRKAVRHDVQVGQGNPFG